MVRLLFFAISFLMLSGTGQADTVIFKNGSRIEGQLNAIPNIDSSFGRVAFTTEEVETLLVDDGVVKIVTVDGQLFTGQTEQHLFFTRCWEEMVEKEEEVCCIVRKEKVALDLLDVEKVVLDHPNCAPITSHPWFISLYLKNGDRFTVLIDTPCLSAIRKGRKVAIPFRDIVELNHSAGRIYGSLKTEAMPRPFGPVDLDAHTLSVRLAKSGSRMQLFWSEIDQILFDRGRSIYQKKRQDITTDAMVLVPEGVLYLKQQEDSTYGIEQLLSRPQEVLVPAFYIDKTEVTNAVYASFVKETGHSSPSHWKDGRPQKGSEQLPVVNVSYFDAKAFAEWAGKRLPTEVEWERAAKGSTQHRYPYGPDFVSSLSNTATQKLKNVGSYAKVLRRAALDRFSFADRIFDMSGNVAEWTNSTFNVTYDLALGGDGRYNPYRTDTEGPFRVVRGGSYRSNAATATTTYRERMHQEDMNSHTGFRCARDRS